MVKKITAKMAQRSADITAVMQTESGARIFRWLIYELGRLEEPVWSDSALTMAMLEGKRAVARELSNELRKLDETYGTDFSRRVIEARFKTMTSPSEKDKEK